MMSRTQITLEREIQRRAGQRASQMGVSLAEYIRRLVARDLGTGPAPAGPAAVFDLDKSGVPDMVRSKDAVLAEAFGGARGRRRRRSA